MLLFAVPAMSSAHGTYRRSMNPGAKSKPSPIQDGWLLVALERPSTLDDEYDRPTCGGSPAMAGGVRIGYDQEKSPAEPPPYQVSYRQAGRTTEATTLNEHVLTDRERILGPDHPDTVLARANLAVSYGHAGRTTHAINLQEHVIVDRERILGPDHPDTVLARANLAVSYQHAGRTTDAIALLERAAADQTRILGAEHPDTIATERFLGRLTPPGAHS